VERAWLVLKAPAARLTAGAAARAVLYDIDIYW
jgi:hypothetical protein